MSYWGFLRFDPIRVLSQTSEFPEEFVYRGSRRGEPGVTGFDPIAHVFALDNGKPLLGEGRTHVCFLELW